MFSGGVTASNFLLNYEAAIDSNFNTFYSSNRFALIKLLNSLVSAAGLSDSMPGIKSTLKASLISISEAAALFKSLKRRAAQMKNKRTSPLEFYSRRAAYFERGGKAYSYNKALATRVNALLNYR